MAASMLLEIRLSFVDNKREKEQKARSPSGFYVTIPRIHLHRLLPLAFQNGLSKPPSAKEREIGENAEYLTNLFALNEKIETQHLTSKLWMADVMQNAKKLYTL